MNVTKQQFEKLLSDLLCELEQCPPWLTAALIEDLASRQGCTRDQAIRELAEFETTVQHWLKASRSHPKYKTVK